ncbi:MAG: hypothetical protein QMD80_07975 [archaeon]|nr:hypothetical protein [archaeon]
MKILAIDIGAGTQDIMVYDEEKGFDNAYKLVLPSPTRIFAEEVWRTKEDVVIFGDTMGGGSLHACHSRTSQELQGLYDRKCRTNTPGRFREC